MKKCSQCGIDYLNLQPLCSKMNRDIKKNNIEYGQL